MKKSKFYHQKWTPILSLSRYVPFTDFSQESVDEYSDHNAANYYEPSEEDEVEGGEERLDILESAYATEEIVDSNVDSYNSDSSSEDSDEDSPEYRSASISDNGSEESYENSSEETYEDGSESSSVDRSWESADDEETGEDVSESMDSHFLVDEDGQKIDLRSTEEREGSFEEETEEEEYESESSESSSGGDSSSSYASVDTDSSEYSKDNSDASSESESLSREEDTNESTSSEEEDNSETSENSSDEKASNGMKMNRAGLKRESTQMSLAEWLLQILIHEENKDEEGGYDGHDQLLLFENQGEKGSDRSGESREKEMKGLDLSNLLSPFVFERTEKDGSQTKYLLNEDFQIPNTAEEGLNQEYSDDDDDEEEEEHADPDIGLHLGHLLLPLPTQEKGKKEEEQERLLLNLIMGHHQ